MIGVDALIFSGFVFNIMKKLIEQLFCKHIFERFYITIGNQFYHKEIWYYDDYQIDKCNKCGKEKNVNLYENL